MYVNVENWLRIYRDVVSTATAIEGWKAPKEHVAVLDFILGTPEAISLVTDVFHQGDVQALKDLERTKAITKAVENSGRLLLVQAQASTAGISWDKVLKDLPSIIRILLTLNARR